MYKSIRPGRTWYDTNGKRIQAHGGSLLYAEGKFWWYGENKEGITGYATGEPCPFWHHGVKLYSSDDLYNWKDEGFAVQESNDINNPFHPVHIMDRPHILYNEKTGMYVLWAKTSKNGSFDGANFSVCVGKSLKNMQFLHEVNPTPYHAGDFDLFIDGGKAYVIFENPHTEMICGELTDDYTNVIGVYSSHLEEKCPPFVREAPGWFVRNGKKYVLTSGTTGYFPNPSKIAEASSPHGEWKDLGDPCVNDVRQNSFHSQFSSVFKHPFVKDLYIAVGDRWLTDLTIDLPDICDMFHRMFDPSIEKLIPDSALRTFTDNNTSEADYVWLPIRFNEQDKPYIEWLNEWTIPEK